MSGIATVRPGESGDLNRMVDLERLNSFTKPWTKSNFQQNFGVRCAHSLVAEVDGQIVGFVIYRKVREAIVIDNLVVMQTYRREGHATRLINELKKQLDSTFTIILIVVQKRNFAVRGFLHKVMFQCHAIRECYYGTREQAGIVDEEVLSGLEFIFCASDPLAKREIQPQLIRRQIFSQRFE